MALSVIYFEQTSGVDDFIVRSAQAADADEMERVVALHLAEIVAINAAIQDAQEKFQAIDANLAAAGDGHTFLFTVTFTRTRLAAVQNLLLNEATALPLNPPAAFVDPALFVTRFAVGSEQDSIDAVTRELISDVLSGITPVQGRVTGFSPFFAIAGGAKGQRFMVGVGMLPSEDIPTPPIQ